MLPPLAARIVGEKLLGRECDDQVRAAVAVVGRGGDAGAAVPRGTIEDWLKYEDNEEEAEAVFPNQLLKKLIF